LSSLKHDHFLCVVQYAITVNNTKQSNTQKKKKKKRVVLHIYTTKESVKLRGGQSQLKGGHLNVINTSSNNLVLHVQEDHFFRIKKKKNTHVT
jgi:hypothetical protein